MEKLGRRRDEVWERVTLLEGGRKWKCNDCGEEFAGGASRIKAHLNKVKGQGIGPCTGKPNSNNDTEHSVLHSQGQIQADDAEDQERIRDLQMMKRYAFECLRPEDKVIVSPLSHLTQEEFFTLKPETYLNSMVIDTFVEILTDIERKKKIIPLNWYLPVTFSVFIPVLVGARPNGHFYLYIIHLKNKVVEIWDSCPPFVAEADRDETTTKLLIAMEKLFEKVTFTEFHRKMADDIRLQLNGFDCGVFVINYMLQSDNYVKRDSSFKFDSQKERENLALKLLNNDLNKEKQNLYDKAIRHYAQVEKQDGNKRLRVDPSKEHLEDAGREMEAEDDGLENQDGNQVENQDGNTRLRVDPSKEHLEDAGREMEAEDDESDEEDDDSNEEDDDSNEEDDGLENFMTNDFDEDDDDLENDLIGRKFQRYTEQIMEWIEDDKVSAIGVWGMGGSGKTALASHIYDKLLEGGDIKVIWVTVSQNSIYNLQKVIARSIKLDIAEEFEVKIIAKKIFQAFKEMKKCVVILDDVWDHFSLQDVGFPMSDNRIKLILTTRIQEVCQGMGCDQKNERKVEFLDKKDSWALFKKSIGSYEGFSLEVKRIAQNVADECEGLPLAIVRIATSMKGKKHVGEWSYMLKCLQNLGHGQYEMEKWVFPVLRSSYDFLGKKLQIFFLYCALSTKGVLYDEATNHLIRIFVYESIDETKQLREQYDEGYNMLERLRNHSMLESHYYGTLWTEEHKCWMNKFLRALAIGIAEDTCKIMANAYKGLIEIPRDDQWKDDLQKVFLTANLIRTIPNGTCPRCSLLSSLFLDGNTLLYNISDDFFNNMPALKTLDLSKTMIERLPESVSSLKCLQALLLSECKELSYIPPLRNLKWLILLDLSLTAITETPLGLESLINLRYLNLLHTPNLVMSASVISKLINLECLELDATAQVGIQGLKNLKVVVANFCDSSVFNTYMNFLAKQSVLESYHLILRDFSVLRSYDLTLEDSSSVFYYDGIHTEYIIKRITFKGMDLRNVIPVIFPRDMNELFIKGCHQDKGASSLCRALSFGSKIDHLDISYCKGVKSLCCLSYLCPFCSSSQLVRRLCLWYLKSLKDIVSPYALLSLHQSSLFSHLTHLEISNCKNMKTLMMPKLLALFRNLHTILVSDCGKMKEIVGEDDHSKMELGGSGELSHPTPITLPRLTSLELEYMPELNFVYRGVMLCPSLQKFSAEDCSQLNSPWIEISNGCKLPMEETSTGYSWEI
ncbi:hypothetical protein QN277_010273 [Acacia crassicarpa]|uniref:Ubiquitin-like protease family profile domain-containing protein n=1 Tax=Acacia crassicarpa TaxID=499986 RepID=A0AAE1JI52_9FABA|nr:hypothetical protein QN277_010273 [Acacia crassicarpa]